MLDALLKKAYDITAKGAIRLSNVIVVKHSLSIDVELDLRDSGGENQLLFAIKKGDSMVERESGIETYSGEIPRMDSSYIVSDTQKLNLLNRWEE